MYTNMVKEYPKPSVTVDIVIFTMKNSELKVLLVKRALEPFKDSWAIPGGFVRIDESLNWTQESLPVIPRADGNHVLK